MISDFETKMLRIEYAKACAKHPNWPEDIRAGLAIITEEFLEAVTAANDHIEKGLCIEKFKAEARHTVVTWLRMLNSLED